MERFKIRFEPDFPPRLPFQHDLFQIASDLDRLVVPRQSITELIDWTLDLLKQIYPGVEVLGPVTVKGGAVIFLGDTGELTIKPVNS